MRNLKWFLVGVALTSFTADYIRMKAAWRDMEVMVVAAESVATSTQATNVSCLVELAYNRSMMESWVERRRLTTLAQVEVLESIDRARDGDAEAYESLATLGFTFSKPGNRLVAAPQLIRGKGVGGF
jgi:hypothetical protein